MAGEPVNCDHPNPLINAIHAAPRLALEKVSAQRTDLPKRRRMVENREIQIGVVRRALSEIDLCKTRSNLIQRWRIQPRSHHDSAERVDVVGSWTSPQESGLHCCCASA